MRRLTIVFALIFLGFSIGIQSQPSNHNSVDQESIKALLAQNEKGILNSVLDVLENTLSITESVAYTLLGPIRSIVKKVQPAIINNPYKHLIAEVRCGEPVSEEELEFRSNRFNKVKVAQEKFLGTKLEDNDVLEIAFACSGGGWRAMSCSLGSCVGANKIGLLDCITYISGLSGSTWFIAPWISSGMDIDTYKKRAIEIICQGLNIQKISDISPMMDNFWVKFAFNESINIVDLYGALLANNLLRKLGADAHRVYLSDQRFIIQKGDFPMPIYTATLGERRMGEFWFEFTPFEVGSRWLRAYSPSWAFGRYFNDGLSEDYAPEQSLGFLMGIFGSAFAADFKDVYDVLIHKLEFPDFLKGVPFAEAIFESIKKVFFQFAYDSDVGDMRIAWGRVFNYVYRMKEISFSKSRDLKLVDAGLDFNNPVFATYRKPPYGKAPDIVFVLDYGVTGGNSELKKLAEHAKENGFEFPELGNIKEIDNNILTVFKNENDVDSPVIVYMPRMNGISLVQKYNYKSCYDYYLKLLEGFDLESVISSGFAHTFNFDYTRKQAEQIVAMTEFNMILSSDQIINIMKGRIQEKQKNRFNK